MASEDGKKGAHPALWVPTLYTAEGLPFVATMTVSVLMYKSLGLTDTKIAAFTSLVALPWSLKPLWTGFMESFGTKKLFVLGTQFFGGIFFALLALSLSSNSFVGWSLACFALIAFNSATHDIAADGLYIESLSTDQQAEYIGYQGAFWNFGKILAQGGLVWLAGTLEKSRGPKVAWTIIMSLFAALLITFSVYHKQVLPSGRRAPSGKKASAIFEEFWHVVATFFQKRYVYWGLAFVILYRLAEGQAQKILPLFLRAEHAKGGLGLATEDVGLAYGVFGAGAFIAGSIAGGYFAANLRLRKALLPLCAIFNLPYITYVFLAWTQPSSIVVITSAIVVEWFGYGFGFVAVTLFMMQQLATGKYKMSHYAIATSAMQLGLILPGVWSGWLSDQIGYRNFFTWVMASTAFSFIVSWLVPFKTEADIAAEDEARVPSFKWLFFGFDGRISRATYWFGQVIVWGPMLLLASVQFAAGDSIALLPAALLQVLKLVGIALQALVTVMLLALDMKRWHDRGRPGALAFLRVAAAVVLIARATILTQVSGAGGQAVLGVAALVLVWQLVELGLLRGTVGPNQHGADPLAVMDAPVPAPAQAIGA
jgi:PAT family beta-lactamase induction signal transducer AmpG